MKFYKQIFIFNRPVFITAAIVLLICLFLFLTLPFNFLLYILIASIFIFTLYFSIGSLFFSYLIYDVSDLYRYTWLKKFVGKDHTILNLFSGYSEGGYMLGNQFSESKIVHLDFFEEGISVTSSIIKAKELSRPINHVLIKYNEWQQIPQAELILFMQSLHELRTAEQKTACLHQAAIHIKKNGKIIIAEHLCDWKNFLIYGPGAFHFFGDRHWKKSIANANLIITEFFFITPFIKVYVLQKNDI